MIGIMNYDLTIAPHSIYGVNGVSITKYGLDLKCKIIDVVSLTAFPTSFTIISAVFYPYFNS